jgi:hypothetical protein
MDVASLPYKIGQLVDGGWIEFRHANLYSIETQAGTARFCVAAARPIDLVLEVLQGLKGPFTFLFVHHTPRSEDAGGRDQSPEISSEDAIRFIHQYRGLFERDARADLWITSASDGIQIVYEKHDLLYFIGRQDSIKDMLAKKGFLESKIELPFPHTHHYHQEFDVDVLSLLSGYEWVKSPLQPGDGE